MIGPSFLPTFRSPWLLACINSRCFTAALAVFYVVLFSPTPEAGPALVISFYSDWAWPSLPFP